MGTWLGHTAPGIFFVSLATWWAIVTSYRYIKANYSKNRSNEKNKRLYTYRGSVSMPCTCCPLKSVRRLPIESLLKFFTILTQVVLEFIMGREYISTDGTDGQDKHVAIHEESLHHVIMFSGFLVAAFVEILIFYGVRLPKKSIYVINFVSVTIFVSTIVLHLDGRDMIDQHLHKLFGLAAFFLLLAFFIELLHPNSFWATYGRAYFLFVIGTWLIQIAFIMWPPSKARMFMWNPMSKRDMSLITFSFGMHLLSAAIYFLMIHLIVQKFYVLFDRCFQNECLDADDEEQLNRFYHGHDYDDDDHVDMLKFNRYEIVMNDVDETEKLCQVDE